VTLPHPIPAPLLHGDEALCEAALGGDAGAFGQLVRRHQSLVFSLVRRAARSPEDAADLTQQAFLRAFEACRRVRARTLPTSDALFRAWLVRIALNLARNHARGQRRWRSERLEARAQGLAAQDASAEERLGEAERARAVHRAVLALPRRQREVLTLRVDGGLPFRDIAEALGITENNAKVQFHHALQRLRSTVPEAAAPPERT
jgi:RNA polymerase sigma-70 factor, ECF subfamily